MTPPEPMNDGAPELEQDEQDAPAGTVRPVLIVRCRSDGILTFANDAYCRAVGRTRAEIAGQTFWAFLPSQERQRGRRHLKSLTPDEPAAAIEYALDARPGRSRPQRWMVHARFDDAGRLIEWSGTGEEVAEESLDWLTDATLHAAILAALPDPFVLFSARGDYLRFRAPQNAPRDETSNAVIGRNIRDALPASIADGLQAAFDRTLASGAVNTLEYTVEDGGKERVLEARIARCAPELLLALIRDRTEERQTAQALGRAEAEARDLQQEIALLGQVASLGVLAG
jgi:PAS domain S-box-containing protein